MPFYFLFCFFLCFHFSVPTPTPIFLWVASTLLEFHFYVSIVLSLYKCSFLIVVSQGIPGGSDGKESACNVGDLGLSPGLKRTLGEESGNPLQYSCLKNPKDRGSWWATVHGVKKNQTQLRMHTYGHQVALSSTKIS